MSNYKMQLAISGTFFFFVSMVLGTINVALDIPEKQQEEKHTKYRDEDYRDLFSSTKSKLDKLYNNLSKMGKMNETQLQAFKGFLRNNDFDSDSVAQDMEDQEQSKIYGYLQSNQPLFEYIKSTFSPKKQKEEQKEEQKDDDDEIPKNIKINHKGGPTWKDTSDYDQKPKDPLNIVKDTFKIEANNKTYLSVSTDNDVCVISDGLLAALALAGGQNRKNIYGVGKTTFWLMDIQMKNLYRKFDGFLMVHFPMYVLWMYDPNIKQCCKFPLDKVKFQSGNKLMNIIMNNKYKLAFSKTAFLSSIKEIHETIIQFQSHKYAFQKIPLSKTKLPKTIDKPYMSSKNFQLWKKNTKYWLQKKNNPIHNAQAVTLNKVLIEDPNDVGWIVF